MHRLNVAVNGSSFVCTYRNASSGSLLKPPVKLTLHVWWKEEVKIQMHCQMLDSLIKTPSLILLKRFTVAACYHGKRRNDRYVDIGGRHIPSCFFSLQWSRRLQSGSVVTDEPRLFLKTCSTILKREVFKKKMCFSFWWTRRNPDFYFLNISDRLLSKVLTLSPLLCCNRQLRS